MAKNGFRQKSHFSVDSSGTIGVVRSRFNEEITSELLNGALQVLKENGFNEDQIFCVEVPGAIEIPVAAKALFAHKNVEAVITLGAVIRGETTHYEWVCQSVERGSTLLALEWTRPVISGVLTVENESQAWDRLGGSHGHKGKEAAWSALEMISILKGLN